MTLMLTIPDEIASEFGVSVDEVVGQLQADLAVLYYGQRRVSLGRAAELSGLKRWEFEKLVAEAGIERDYSAEDLAKDLAWARGGG
jgi:predicted HTH domain antitoxin